MLNHNQSLEIKKLEKPPQEFSPSYFWSFNDRLDGKVLLEQLDDMFKHGVRSVCIHPLPKEFRPKKFANQMEPNYLSNDYLKLIGELVEKCKAKGMNFYLYDEGGWPSGGAAGRVKAQESKEFARKTVQKIKGKIVILEEKDTIDKSPPYPNVLTHGVAEKFIELTHEQYKLFIGKHFGETIKYAFTDEPAFPYINLEGEIKQLTWYDDLPEDFKNKKRYEIEPYIGKILDQERSHETIQAQIDYYDVCSLAFAERFLKPLKIWCKKNRLKSGGHLGGEDLPANNARCGFGHILRSLRELNLPGIDAIWRQIHPENGIVFFPKYAQSVARQSQGDDLVLSESFMVYGNGLTPSEMKWIIDLQLAQGVTNFILGHYPYSVKDHFMLFCRPFWGQKNPFWKHMQNLHSYMERLCWLLSRGKADCSVAVYYPIRDIWAGKKYKSKAVKSHNCIAKELLKKQCDYDFIDDDALRVENIKSKELKVGPANYKTIILPESKWISQDAQNTLSLFEKNGGQIIRMPSSLSCHKTRQILSNDCLMKHIHPLLEANPSNDNLLVNKRVCGNCRIYFIFNSGFSVDRISLNFPDTGSPLLYNPVENKFKILESLFYKDRQRIDTEFSEGESKIIIFTEDPDFFAGAEKNSSALFEEFLTFPNKWLLKPLCKYFVDDNNIEVMTMDNVSFSSSCLKDWRDIEFLGKDFSGTVEYGSDFEFYTEIEDKKYLLDLGSVKHAAEIELNGCNVGTMLWKPFRIEITNYLKKGMNSLKIKITNSLANALLAQNVQENWRGKIGKSWPDIVPPYNERQLEFEKESLNGGLYGPVKILIERVAS